MAINEQIVTGRKYRRLLSDTDGTKLWQRLSFWTKAQDVEFDDGDDAETKVSELETAAAEAAEKAAEALEKANSLSGSYQKGYDAGYSSGNSDGYTTGYNAGYEAGRTQFNFTPVGGEGTISDVTVGAKYMYFHMVSPDVNVGGGYLTSGGTTIYSGEISQPNPSPGASGMAICYWGVVIATSTTMTLRADGSVAGHSYSWYKLS